MNFLRRVRTALACLLVATLLLQVGFFAFMALVTPTPPASADLIVVFPGTPERIEGAFELARQGFSKRLLVMESNETSFTANLQRQSPLPPGAMAVFRQNGRNTLGDAIIARDVSRSLGARSVILVTSSYHLPRSSLLLGALLFNSPAKLAVYGVEEKGLARKGLFTTFRGLHTVGIELLKMWSSLAELGWYAFSGKTLQQVPGAKDLMHEIKQRI